MSWLLNTTPQEKPYQDHSKTDVMETFKRFGFIPPSEQKRKENNALETMPKMRNE